MSNLLVVLPVIFPETANKCVDSLLMPNSSAGIDPDDVLIIDNSRDGWGNKYGLRTYRDPGGHNLGVARAWNIGVREVLEKGLDYLVIMSASMMFGPELHTNWVRQMEVFWGTNVIEADGHSWHLIAIHRRVFEQVGEFDEQFYPAYFEQIDFGYRMRMVGLEQGFARVWINAISQGSALHSPMISCPAKPLLDYYADKWGGVKGQEKFTKPWGRASLGFYPKESVPEVAARYGLDIWW